MRAAHAVDLTKLMKSPFGKERKDAEEEKTFRQNLDKRRANDESFMKKTDPPTNEPPRRRPQSSSSPETIRMYDLTRMLRETNLN